MRYTDILFRQTFLIVLCPIETYRGWLNPVFPSTPNTPVSHRDQQKMDARADSLSIEDFEEKYDQPGLFPLSVKMMPMMTKEIREKRMRRVVTGREKGPSSGMSLGGR